MKSVTHVYAHSVTYVVAPRRGETSEEGGREAGFLADQIEPADDSGLGASAFPGDLSGAEGLNAVQAKDFGDGRGWPAPAGIEFLKQGEGGTGNTFGGRSRLRGGLKWELVGPGILIFDFNHGKFSSNFRSTKRGRLLCGWEFVYRKTDRYGFTGGNRANGEAERRRRKMPLGLPREDTEFTKI